MEKLLKNVYQRPNLKSFSSFTSHTSSPFNSSLKYPYSISFARKTSQPLKNIWNTSTGSINEKNFRISTGKSYFSSSKGQNENDSNLKNENKQSLNTQSNSDSTNNSIFYGEELFLSDLSIDGKDNIKNHDEHQMGEAVIGSHQQDEGNSQGVKVMKKRRVRLENAKEQKVPSSSVSRAMGFAGLGLSLAASAVKGSVKNIFSSEKTSLAETIGSDENAEKITQLLCRMRGVPLKLGQALSMQEEQIIPKPISEAMARAQKNADIMPLAQLNKMLEDELGANWRDNFLEFETKPVAAASIGQVHRAKTKDGIDVAVKVQYPGVADSIDSDLNNLKMILGYTKLLPTSFFFGDLIRNMRDELKEECDYLNEAAKQMEFREAVKDYPCFYVPKIISHLTTRHVLTSEWIDGLSVEECIQTLNQEQKDKLGHLLSLLTWTQLFEFRFMQTDPNPANYFYDPEKNVLYLLDYGAAKRFDKKFAADYLDMLHAAIHKDKERVLKSSIRLGILTGEESRDMIETHIHAVFLVGEPFVEHGHFDFGNQSITKRVYEKLPVIIEKRLKPPPLEVFALHRLLGGAFLMLMRLGSVVEVRKLFEEIYKKVIDDLRIH